MGIIAIFLLITIILIFLVSNNSKLSLKKKIIIIVSVLLLIFGALTYIFITGWERGRTPKKADFEKEAKENSIQNQKSDSAIVKTPEKELKSNPENNIEQNGKLLFEIEGEYSFENKVAECKLNLNLFYQNNQLKYQLKTNSREIYGNAILELNEEKNGYYIMFENIEWSEYLGEIDPEGNGTEANLPLPQEISGSLYKNEIVIQNYGNAMNYYVKLAECDVKYIELKRNSQ